MRHFLEVDLHSIDELLARFHSGLTILIYFSRHQRDPHLPCLDNLFFIKSDELIADRFLEYRLKLLHSKESYRSDCLLSDTRAAHKYHHLLRDGQCVYLIELAFALCHDVGSHLLAELDRR
jgi:hypothetical protein